MSIQNLQSKITLFLPSWLAFLAKDWCLLGQRSLFGERSKVWILISWNSSISLKCHVITVTKTSALLIDYPRFCFVSQGQLLVGTVFACSMKYVLSRCVILQCKWLIKLSSPVSDISVDALNRNCVLCLLQRYVRANWGEVASELHQFVILSSVCRELLCSYYGLIKKLKVFRLPKKSMLQDVVTW